MTTVAIVNDGREIGRVTWDGERVVMDGGAEALLGSGVRVVDESLAELAPDSEAYVQRLPVCLAGTRVWAEPREDVEPVRAYIESQHPRDPGGEGGGQWIKKGTTAAGKGTMLTDEEVDSIVDDVLGPEEPKGVLGEDYLNEVEPRPPDEEVVSVTGRTLKEGDRFWIPGGQYEVVRDAGGLGRYVTVRDLETGREMIMKASQKVDVRKADFPDAAKRAERAARGAPMHVEGELGKVFSSTLGKTNPITVAAQEASDDLAQAGIVFPDNLTKIPLKETRARGTGGQFVWTMNRSTGEVSGTLQVNKALTSREEMPSTIHHEVGHYLDMIAIPQAAARVGYAPGVEPAPVRLSAQSYASLVRHPEIAGPVMDAIDASAAGQRLADMQNRTSQYAIIRNRPGMEGETAQYPVDRGHVRYVNDSSEKFARAYEQYISTKVGKRADYFARQQAHAADDYYLEPGEDAKGFYAWYWDPEDFKPISAEFDKMFARLGWSKS
jgi:hypothetical protein